MPGRTWLRFFLALAVCVLLAPADTSAETAVGTVKRLRPEVEAVRAAEVLKLEVASNLEFQDLLRSGDDARLEAEFLDGTRLTLGENAELRLDSYVYDPDNALRNRLIAKIKGAFLFISGRMKGSGSKVSITTPSAVVDVLGTTFWAGPVDDGYGVLAVAGVVSVTTDGGSVSLSDGQGTVVTGAGAAPGQPAVWSDEKRKRALAAVAFE